MITFVRAMSAAKRAWDTTSEVPGHLTCSVCLEPPVGRIEQCPLGHILCADGAVGCCLVKVRAHALPGRAKCPMCRCVLKEPLPRNLVAEQAVAALPATCRHCAGASTRGGLAAHEGSCGFAPRVPCAAAAAGCAWEGTASQLAPHMKQCLLACQRQGFEDQLLFLSIFLAENIRDKVRTLIWAAAHNMSSVIARLLAAGGDVDAVCDAKGVTALYEACARGHVDIVAQLIAARADVNKGRADTGATPLFIACSNGQVGAVDLLLGAAGVDANKARTDNTRTTPLTIACYKGHIRTVARLIAHSAVDVDLAPTIHGATPLYYAAQQRHMDILHQLIAVGADVNKGRTDADASTPLHMAAAQGHIAVVRALLAAGADVNAAGSDCTTPLFIAICHGHMRVAHLLLHVEGVDVNVVPTGSLGCTPLYMATMMSNIPLMIVLLGRGADVNAAHDGSTPLYVAASQGRWRVVELLLAQPGVDVNVVRRSGETALFAAAEGGFGGVVDRLLAVDGIELTRARASDKHTPVTIATARGHVLTAHQIGLAMDQGAATTVSAGATRATRKTRATAIRAVP